MNISFVDGLIAFAYFFSLFIIIYWFIYFLEKKEDIDEENDSEIPKLKKTPLVTIVIPAYNEEKHIIKTLNSVIKLDYPPKDLEIIVVNDCSKDKTKNIVEEFIKNKGKGFNIKIINNKKNLGKAESLNVALKKCKGEFFGCIDADSEVESDALVRMIHMFEVDHKLAITTPVMKISNPKTWIQKFQRLEYMASTLVSRLMGYLDTLYVAPGPFSIYKKSVLEKLGGFDGKYNIEDQEIAWRAQKHNFKIRQCVNAYVHTVGPSNLKHFNRQRTRWYRGSIMNMYHYRKMFFNKKYGDFGMVQAPIIILSYLMAIISLFAFTYFVILPTIRQIKHWFLIRFDLWTEITSATFKINYLDLEINKLILAYFALVLTVILLYFASRSSNDRVRKYGNIYILLYFFTYYILLGIILLKTIFEIIFRKKQKW